MARSSTITVAIDGDAKGAKRAFDDTEKGAVALGKKLDRTFATAGGGAGSHFSSSFADTVDHDARQGRLARTFNAVGRGAAVGLTTAFAAIGGARLFGGFIKEAEDAAKTAKQTEAAIRSTGGAANVSASDIDRLATALSNKSGIDDEVIASSQNVLLTFTRVRNEVGAGNDVFNQGAAAALNMSAALGGDLQSATMTVGKALNDPLKGITALTRAGVQFTDAQKDQIKALVESGDTLGAQKIILGELETQFGGMAAASATTSQKLSVAWGNIQEQIGTALMPVFNAVSNWFLENGPKIVDIGSTIFSGIGNAIGFVVDNQPVLIGALSAVAFGMGAWAVSAGAAAAATIAAAAPFIALGAAIAGLVGGLVWAYQNVEWFRGAVDTVRAWIVDDFVPALTAAWEWVREAAAAAWPVIASIVSTVADAIGAAVSWITGDLVPALVAAWQWASDTGQTIWAAVQGTVTTAIDVIATAVDVGVGVVRGVWAGLQWLYDFVKNVVIDPILAYVDVWWAVFSTAVEAGVAAVKATWNTLVAIWHFLRDDVIAPVTDGIEAFRDTVGRIFDEAVGAATGAWAGIVSIWHFIRDEVIDPISGAIERFKDYVANAFGAAADGVKAAWDRLRDIAAAPIKFIVETVYNKGIVKVWNAIPLLSDLEEISLPFATGGYVPGQRTHRDDVNAVLTPGEFVVPERAADWFTKRMGKRGVLDVFREPWKHPTMDPGVFGYAAGGFAVSAPEALAWAQQHDNKPYQFPMVGPSTFDCSGFMSAILNFIQGRYPYARRFSTGDFPGIAGSLGLSPGLDPQGFSIGVRTPYARNAQGAFVGHTAGTLAGVAVEAGGKGVHVGPPSQHASNFPLQYHLTGFGGLGEADKALVRQVDGLGGLAIPKGDNVWSTAFYDFFRNLIPRIMDHMVRNIPGVKQLIEAGRALADIVNDVGGAVGGWFSSGGNGIGGDFGVDAFLRPRDTAGGGGDFRARGGPVLARHPYIVGDGGVPELFVPNTSGYIHPDVRETLAGDNTVNLIVQGSIFGDAHLRKVLDDWQREMARELIAMGRQRG